MKKEAIISETVLHIAKWNTWIWRWERNLWGGTKVVKPPYRTWSLWVGENSEMLVQDSRPLTYAHLHPVTPANTNLGTAGKEFCNELILRYREQGISR